MLSEVVQIIGETFLQKHDFLLYVPMAHPPSSFIGEGEQIVRGHSVPISRWFAFSSFRHFSSFLAEANISATSEATVF